MNSILLVEDDPLVRRSLSRALVRAGFHVVAAGSGEQALHLLEMLGGESLFRAVLSDYDLGDGIDGEHLIAEVKERYSAISLFGMSGAPSNWDAANERGDVVGVWEKGYPLDTLLGMLTEEIGR